MRQIFMWLFLVSISSLAIAEAFGQPNDYDQMLQPVLSSLRACAKSNVAEAYSAGVRGTGEAEEFLFRRCDSVVSIELRKAMAQGLGAVPPGQFRFTVREEWAAYMADRP